MFAQQQQPATETAPNTNTGTDATIAQPESETVQILPTEESVELPTAKPDAPETLTASITAPSDAPVDAVVDAPAVPMTLQLSDPTPDSLVGSIGDATPVESTDVEVDVEITAPTDEVNVVDFGSENTDSAPSIAINDQPFQSLPSVLNGLLSSFFGDGVELNASPSETVDGEVDTETREIPGGFVMIRRFATPFGEGVEQKTEQEVTFDAAVQPAATESIEVDPMMAIPPMPRGAFPPPPPPRMPRGGAFSFLHRFFGPPPPPPMPFMRRGMFPRDDMIGGPELESPTIDDAPMPPKRGIMHRLRSMLHAFAHPDASSDDFPPPPPPFADFFPGPPPPPQFDGETDVGEGEGEGEESEDQMMAGPFMKPNFGDDEEQTDDTNFVDAEEVDSSASTPNDEDASNTDSTMIPPTVEEQSAASQDGFVAPHMWSEVDYRAASTVVERPAEEPFQFEYDHERLDDSYNDHHHYRGHHGKMKWFIIGGAVVAGIALVLFAIFMVRRRRRLLAEAHMKPTLPLTMPPAPIAMAAMSTGPDGVTNVPAYQVQLTRPLLQ